MDDENPNNINPNEEMPTTGGDEPRPESNLTEESISVEETSSVEELASPDDSNSPRPYNPSMSSMNTPSDNIVFTDKPKKSKTGLIIGIICALIILGGAGVFIALYAINNQPENIIASSIDKFVNAKNISTTGTISLDFDEDTTGIDEAALTLGAATSSSDETGNLSLAVTLADGTEIENLSVGETLMNDGTLYLKFDGLEELYDKYLSQYLLGYTAVDIEDYNTDTTVDVEEYATTVSTYYADIISQIDGEWFEISIDDVLDSDYLSSIMDSDSKKQIKNDYSCIMDTINNGQKYSKELSDLYNKHKFIIMTSGENSYYNISFATTPLTDFLNGIYSTSLATDFFGCMNVDASNVTVDSEDIEDFVGQLPNISAKFDGFFGHELSALKITDENEAYTLNADLKFTYPNSLNISAPENATPIMERVEDIITNLSEIDSETNPEVNPETNSETNS